MLRLMSYNVHICIGMDGRLSPERIARVIAQYRPHVVALQELDVGRARTDEADQAHEIARRLKMEFHFHPSLRVEEELYGDAVLSRLPLRLVKAGGLPGLPLFEPRGALWVEIATPAGPLQFLNTHLGLTRRERRLQTDALMGPDWLDSADTEGPWVLAGDLNALPRSRTCRRFGERLRDAQLAVDDHRPQATFFARRPTARIDYIFVDPSVDVVAARVPSAFLAKVASDHLPLIVDIRLPVPNRGSAVAPSRSRTEVVG
ncbi:MAG: EEP domain-containing protein [Inquilinus sp.]|nr:EEP domain-containing protein [Inquilinus sp.]